MLDIVVIRRILPTFGEKGVERQEGFPRDVARGRRQLEPAVRTRETRRDTGQRRVRPAGASLVPSGGLEAPAQGGPLRASPTPVLAGSPPLTQPLRSARASAEGPPRGGDTSCRHPPSPSLSSGLGQWCRVYSGARSAVTPPPPRRREGLTLQSPHFLKFYFILSCL